MCKNKVKAAVHIFQSV